MDRRRALVIGGSLGGLFAANLLRSIGWDVAVFERAKDDLAGRGAGLGTRAELFDVMRRVGIDLDPSIGAEASSRIALDRNGETICEVPVRTITTAWDRMYRALKAALPPESYRSGMQLECFEQDRQKVAAVFADGSRAEGDLLIGADGIHSTVRRQLLPGTRAALRRLRQLARRGGREQRRRSLPFRGFTSHGLLLPGRRTGAVDPDAGTGWPCRSDPSPLSLQLVPAGR